MQDTKKATSYPDNQARREYGDFAGKWEFGSNPSAELWNGRLAMIGFAAAVIIELMSGQGLLHFWGLV